MALHKSVLEAEMARGVLHDANNMLMVAETNLELWTSRTPAMESELEELARAIEGMETAIAPLMRFTRSSGSLAVLRNVLIDAQPMLQHILTKKIRLEIPPQGGEKVEVPCGHWLHALLAIGFLAKLALPHGGTLRLSIACRPAGEASNDEVAELTIEAIVPEEEPTASPPTEAATDVKRELTLQVIEDIAAELKGRFHAGVGAEGAARWTLETPCRSMDAPAGEMPHLKEGTILVAHPDAYARSMIQSSLQAAGWTVYGHESLVQLMATWRQTPEAALIIDGPLLDETGPELLNGLEAGGKRVIVLRPAGHVAPKDWERSSLRILQKPFQMGELATLVKIALLADPHKETNR